MTDSRDITGKNRKFTGSKGIQLPQGSESERVTELGQLRFNTDTKLAEYYDGVAWKSIDAPPVVTGFSIDGGSIITAGDIDDEAAGDATIVISGSNFDTTSGTVTFEPETSGSTVNTQTITRTSTNSFTVTVTRSEFTEANGPYSLVLTNGSGLAATIGAAITADQDPPNFDTAAGSLGTAYNTLEVTGSQFDASATDPDGDTISYSVVSGSLPSGLTIGASTGLITGTPSGNATGTYTFTVEAATNFGNSTRQFSIDIEDLPSGGSITQFGDYRIHAFNSSGTFTNTVSNLSADALLVAGGGGGGSGQNPCNNNHYNGGGGGAGGIIFKENEILTAGGKSVTVGSGGSGAEGDVEFYGEKGGNTTALGYTALGGGGGESRRAQQACGSNPVQGDGGSGGGRSDGSGVGRAGDALQPGSADGGFGNEGGLGSNQQGGGGGGAGAPGQDAPDGDGGIGLDFSSTFGTSFGENGYFGGGGGGGDNGQNLDGEGGLGGGGNGQDNESFPGENGSPNTGGGGGGGAGETPSSGNASGGDGGSGTVLIRYDITNL